MLSISLDNVFEYVSVFHKFPKLQNELWKYVVNVQLHFTVPKLVRGSRWFIDCRKVFIADLI